MLVLLTTPRAGVLSFHAEGEVVDLPDAEAAALVRTGQAEPVAQPAAAAVVETAVAGVRVETAVARHPKPSRKHSHAS